GGKIEPGTFQQFPLSVGELPTDTDQLVFKALQTYDDQQVVRWIEVPKKGAAEPENPAPVLKLTAPAEGGSGHGEAAQGASGDQSGSAACDQSDTTARTLGIAGILTGLAGIAFGVLAGRRRSA